MRIFERLRGRDRDETNIERKLIDTVTTELLRDLEEGIEVAALSFATGNKQACCSCCSAEAVAR